MIVPGLVVAALLLAAGPPDAGPATAEPVSRKDAGETIRAAKKLADKGERARAISDLEAALRDYPESAEVYAVLGALLLAEGDAERAETRLRDAVALEPRHAPAWSNLASILERKASYPKALEAASAAVDLAPRDPGYRLDRAIIHYRVRRYDDAVADAELAVASLSKDPMGLRDVALIRLGRGESGDAVKAVSLLEGASALAPTDASLALALARAQLAAGRTRDAQRTLTPLVKDNPSHPWVAWSLALIAWREGDEPEARRLGDKARRALPALFRPGSYRRERFYAEEALVLLRWLDEAPPAKTATGPRQVRKLASRASPSRTSPKVRSQLEVLRVSVRGAKCKQAPFDRRVRRVLSGAAVCFGERPGKTKLALRLRDGRLEARGRTARSPTKVQTCLLRRLRPMRFDRGVACAVDLSLGVSSPPKPPPEPKDEPAAQKPARP